MSKKPFSLLFFPLCLFPVFLVFLFISLAHADRGIQISYKDNTGKQNSFLYENSHALLIGASNYTNGWPVLPGVVKDVKLLKEGLEKQGFSVMVVMDPNRRELEDAFHLFITKYGRGKNNRLLIYFAGHGHTLKLAYGEEMGYIVPVDAPNPNRDKDGFLDKALDMQQMEVYAKRIQSKHALFLFDSCFSGSLFALSRAVPENINYKTQKPVRQFITAGSANETVPDESIFREQFLAALNGEGDSDKDGYLTGVELGEFLQKTVVNYSKGSQHPQYGKIRNPHLDKGDFVFEIKELARLDPSQKDSQKDSPKDRSVEQDQGMTKQMMEQNKQMMEMQKMLMEMIKDERKKQGKLEVELEEQKATVKPMNQKETANAMQIKMLREELAKIKQQKEIAREEKKPKTWKKTKKAKVRKCLDEESMSFEPC